MPSSLGDAGQHLVGVQAKDGREESFEEERDCKSHIATKWTDSNTGKVGFEFSAVNQKRIRLTHIADMFLLAEESHTTGKKR